MQSRPLLRMAFAIAAFLIFGAAACIANNNLFLPGDAFFPTLLTKDEIAKMRKTKSGARTFERDSKGAWHRIQGLCWLPLGIAVRRPQTRFCRQRSQKLRQRSVAARERSGSYECHDLRGARPLALECSSGSSPSRCRPIAAIAFPMGETVCSRKSLIPKISSVSTFSTGSSSLPCTIITVVA